MADISAALRGLSSDFAVPMKVRKRADALLQRLSVPIRVAVDGPNVAMVADLLHRLSHDLDEAAVSNQVEDADIAVWCTQVFGPDEVSFWGAAPATLQDHSLLVGPDDPHVQTMGSAYFRQYCKVCAVTDVLKRQLKQGREADTDQAVALLARHPANPVAASVIVEKPACAVDNPIVTYLQKQADDLAAMDIADTPACSEAVLAHCVQTVHHLNDLMDEVDEKGLQDAVFDAVDEVTLMTLEGDIAAAADAVAVLIALKMRFMGAVRQIETKAVHSGV